MIALQVIWWLLPWVTMVWIVAAFCASVVRDLKRRIPLAERVHRKLWLPAGPGILVDIVNTWNHGGFATWTIPFQALTLLWWWQLRDWPDDDDDTWTKRGKKLKNKIGVLVRGSRLVVGQVRT